MEFRLPLARDVALEDSDIPVKDNSQRGLLAEGCQPAALSTEGKLSFGPQSRAWQLMSASTSRIHVFI